MSRFTRRSFLRSSLALGSALSLAPHARALGANDDLRLAVVGFRGQGGLHIRLLRELPGVRVVALCDADRSVLERGVAQAASLGQPVEGYLDVRELLESKDIDAITTATPNHWHALVTVWGCQAGKDVYVEKPLSQNIFEGRQTVAAAQRYNRIVQWGNQSHGHRTGPPHLERPGLGKIRVVWTSLNRMRQSIGRVDGPQPVPASVDYDLWTGPAPLEPLMRRNLHYDWHWVWPTGSGEIGNNGIYPLDAARLRLGLNTLPKRVMSLGGRFLFDDDGQTPNTQIALFQYDPGPLLICEVRNLPSEEGPKTISGRARYEEGDAGLPGTSGPEGDRGGFSGHKGHLFNFVSAVRSRQERDLRAPLIEGHLSSSLVHMANISYRLGSPLSVEQAREAISDQGDEATEVFDGFREHLKINGVDFAKTRIVVGPWLEMDPRTERFVGTSDLVANANELAHGHYRPPFVVPEIAQL
jgi:predicted dehydrogenase